MTDLPQELMTPDEAAKWFRRSDSWLRRQRDLLRVGSPRGMPLYHVCVCRAYLLGLTRGLSGPALRTLQLRGLAAACGVAAEDEVPDVTAGATQGAE